MRFMGAKHVMALAVGVMLTLITIPLALLFVTSLRTSPPYMLGYYTTSNYVNAFRSEWFLSTFSNTLYVTGVTILFALFWGVPMAFLTTKTNTPFSNIITKINLLNFFFPPFVTGIAWYYLMDSRIGVLPRYIPLLSSIQLSGPWGIGWVMGGYYTPYVFLFASDAFRSIPSDYEEASAICGAGNLRTFLGVTLRLAIPAILSSVILVFVLASGSFSVPLILGSPQGFYTLTTKIFSVLYYPPARHGMAAVMSIFFIISAVPIIYLYRTRVKGGLYAVVGGKGGKVGRMDLRKWKFLGLGFNLSFLVVMIVLPLVVVVMGSLFRTFWRFDTFPTLENYYSILAGPYWGRIFLMALKNTMISSAGSATVITLVSVFLAWIGLKERGLMPKLVEYIVMVPLAIPSLIFSVGILWTWVYVRGVYGSLWVFFVAFCTVMMSYGLRSLSPAMLQISDELVESSRLAGATLLSTFRHILMPLLRSPMLSAWLLVFIVSVRELPIVSLIYTPNTITLSVFLLGLWESSSYTEVAALGTIMAAIVATVIALFYKVLGVEVALG